MVKKLSGEDWKNLTKSLQLIEKELGFVVERYSEVVPAPLKALDIKEHWKLVQPAFGKALKILPTVSFQSLQDHGLVGLPLEAKLSFLMRTIDVVHDRISALPVPKPNILRKLLAWLLKVLENLLESLAAVLPPLGGVTEFKKQVESGLEFPEAVD